MVGVAPAPALCLQCGMDGGARRLLPPVSLHGLQVVPAHILGVALELPPRPHADLIRWLEVCVSSARHALIVP